MERKTIPCPKCGREKYFEGLCWICKATEERQQWEAMGEVEVETCIQNIIQNIEKVDKFEQEYEDFLNLLAYHDINTRRIADAAFEKKVFGVPTLYRDASEEVQGAMIQMLEQDECPEANLILCCLAVCGSEKVREAFYRFEKEPKGWQRKLCVSPSVYAEMGGWSFDDKGERYSLIHDECYPLLPSDRQDDAVKVGVPIEGKCKICGCDLVNILEIDGNDSRLSFLGIEGKIKLPICINCAGLSEKTVIRYQGNGAGSFEIVDSFEDENYISSDSVQAIQKKHLTLSLQPKPTYYACGCDEMPHLGGQANWVQDAQYEVCPDCGKKMQLMGSIPWESLLEDNTEGTLYLNHCSECKVVVAFHQQT